MKLAIAQIAPRLLDRDATLAKVVASIADAGRAGCSVVAFGESLVPGYPLWLCRTGGARFDDPDQKRLFARYAAEAVSIEEGHLRPVCEAAATAGVVVVLGIVERPADRGGHSLFCSRVVIGADGEVLSVHRKLVPTYEERLVWSAGDGAGLVTHRVEGFTLGALNCWENWMPLARAALHAAGEDLHVMLWPGSRELTSEITRFAAREGRSYVVSAGALLRAADIPADMPLRDAMADAELLYDGGSCIAGPDGEWVVEPQCGSEELIVAELDPARVFEERQNFDPSGHYARPDVLRLGVNRRRLSASE
ncbi:MAG: carbon-nitrogen hydrolase family protein [Planctomycetota bacterium]